MVAPKLRNGWAIVNGARRFAGLLFSDIGGSVTNTMLGTDAVTNVKVKSDAAIAESKLAFANTGGHTHTGAAGTGTKVLWGSIDKTTSSIADITTKSHTALTDIGTNTHAQIDTAVTASTNHIAATASVHGVSASGFEDKANKGVTNGYATIIKAAALTPGANVSINPTLGNVFTLVPDQTGNINMASQIAGHVIHLIITTSGTNSYTLTFNTGFKTTGTLATGTASGKVFVLSFVSDGTNYNEVSRTAAM